MPVIQVPWIILPTNVILGTEVETINNLAEHTSREFPVDHLQEKMVHIIATEVVVMGVPGNLNCWIELSPVPSVNNLMWPAPLPFNPAAWGAIGGGGGISLPATSPVIEVATGVNATVHTILIPWTIHSSWARLVMQTPVSATPLTSFWMVQATFSAGSK